MQVYSLNDLNVIVNMPIRRLCMHAGICVNILTVETESIKVKRLPSCLCIFLTREWPNEKAASKVFTVRM